MPPLPIDDIIKGDPDAYKILTQKVEKVVSVKDVQKQLDPLQHNVFNEGARPRKQVEKPTGQKDDEGNDKTETTSVDVNRLPASFQSLILGRAVAFLYGNKIEIKVTPQDDKQKQMVSSIESALTDNKMDFKRKERARLAMSECEAATIWYVVDNPNAGKEPKRKVKCMLLSESKGDTLYPHFDMFGSMDAFSREYIVTVDGKKTTCFDVYTDNFIYHFIKGDSGLVESNIITPAVEKNEFGKIPVIYTRLAKPIWYDVQRLIERFEERFSNTADTNDYNGDPMLLLKGDTPQWFDKGERGKVVTTDKDGDGKYVTYDAMNGSVEFEMKTLKELIYTLTHTPDISFENMKSLGSDISGIALKLMFMDAHLAAENRWEIFGESEQRELNLLKTVIGNVVDVTLKDAISLPIEPVMTPYLPRNEKEVIDNLIKANGGLPIIAQEESINESPYGYDGAEQIKKLDLQAEKEAQRVSQSISGSAMQ